MTKITIFLCFIILIFGVAIFILNKEEIEVIQNQEYTEDDYICNLFDVSKIDQFSDESYCNLFKLYDEECFNTFIGDKGSFIRLSIFSKMNKNYILKYSKLKHCSLYEKKIIPAQGFNLFSYNFQKINIEYSIEKKIVNNEVKINSIINSLSPYFSDTLPIEIDDIFYLLEVYVDEKYSKTYSTDLILQKKSSLVKRFFP